MSTTIPTTTTPSRQAPEPAGQRFAALDAGRFIAAIAVIYWHSVTDPTCRRYLGLATWSVPFFSAAAVYLLANGLARNPLRPFGAYARERVVRIGAPFVAWSAVYLLARNAEHLLVAGKPAVPLEWAMLWGSTAHHLWFLPFIMGVCLVLFLPLRAMQRHRFLIPIIATLSLAGAAAILALPGPPKGLEYLLMQAWVTTPAVLGAVALACAASLWRLGWATTIRWPLLALAVIAVLLNAAASPPHLSGDGVGPGMPGQSDVRVRASPDLPLATMPQNVSTPPAFWSEHGTANLAGGAGLAPVPLQLAQRLPASLPALGGLGLWHLPGARGKAGLLRRRNNR